MCPICLANLAMVAVAATSTGGAATVFINKFRAKKDAMAVNKVKEPQIKEKAS